MKFKTTDYKQVPNGKSDIYMLLGQDEEILYIGKSQNLRSRLSNYFGTSCNWGLDHLEEFWELFKYVKVKYVDISRLKIEEKALIELHKPPLNVEHNAKFTKRYELMDREAKEDPALEIAMKNFRNK